MTGTVQYQINLPTLSHPQKCVDPPPPISQRWCVRFVSFLAAEHSRFVDKTHKEGRNHWEVRYCKLESVRERHSEYIAHLQQRYGASLRKQVKKVHSSAPSCCLQRILMFLCRWKSLSMPVTHARSAARQVVAPQRPIGGLSISFSRTR